MVCEKCGAPMPDEGPCPLCDWAPGMEEEAPAETQTAAPAEGQARSDAEVVAALMAGDEEKAAPVKAASQTPEGQPKKSRKGLIAAAVCAVAVVAVAAGLFFGLGGKSASPMDEAMEQVLELVEPLPDNATDVSDLTVGIPANTVLLTVDGEDVTAEEYLYWLGYLTNYYDLLSSYSGATMDLTLETEDGLTWDDQLKLAARDNAILLALTPTLAREVGVELTPEDLQDIVDNRLANIEEAGGEAMYAHQLQAMGINDVTALRMDVTSVLYGKYQDAWMDKTVAELTGEEIADYAAENDLLRAKHILLLTMDMTTGEDLPEDERAAQKAKADDLLAQLQADPTKFDDLMNENSEDTGLIAYPDGYLFTAGEMVTEFEDATRALEFGEISGVVESPYGYHIILRLDPDCDEIREEMAASRFNDEVQDRVDQADVVESEAYQSFTTAQYYEALLDFQYTLTEPGAEEAGQSAGEIEPTVDDDAVDEPAA